MAVDTRSQNIYSRFALYAILVLVAFIFLFPLLFMLMSSLKSNAAIFSDLKSIRAVLPVGDLSLDNYLSLFDRVKLDLFFMNSIIITCSTLVMGLFVNSMAAFALARLEWKGRQFALTAIITLLIIPIEAIVVPMLLLVSRLPWIGFEGGEIILEMSWLNSLHVQIIPFIANAFSIYLFYQFFSDIPKDFDEAAYVDGATPFQVYYKVIMPLAGPVIATVLILQFLAMWNQYLWPILVVQGEAARPVMPGIQQFFGRTTSWGEVMAYATLITLPVLIVFLIFQRRFVRSVAGAGVKG